MIHYIDKNGVQAAVRGCEWATAYRNGIACVKYSTGSVCIVDRFGFNKMRMPDFQEDPTALIEDRAVVRNRRLFGYVDLNGHLVIPPAYLYAEAFSERVAVVQTHDGYTLIDSSGHPKCERFYRRLNSFREGKSVANIAGQNFYINHELDVVLGPFDAAEDFAEDLAFVVQRGTESYIGHDGEVRFVNRWDALAPGCHGGRIQFSHADKYGFLDKKGNIVIEPRYEDAGLFSEGIAIVDAALYKLAIDVDGRTLFRANCEWIGNFSDGVARFSNSNRYGYMDRAGNVIIAPQFAWADDFSEGLAAVEPHA